MENVTKFQERSSPLQCCIFFRIFFPKKIKNTGDTCDYGKCPGVRKTQLPPTMLSFWLRIWIAPHSKPHKHARFRRMSHTTKIAPEKRKQAAKKQHKLTMLLRFLWNSVVSEFLSHKNTNTGGTCGIDQPKKAVFCEQKSARLCVWAQLPPVSFWSAWILCF